MDNYVNNNQFMALELVKLSGSGKKASEIVDDYNYILDNLIKHEKSKELKELEDRISDMKKEKISLVMGDRYNTKILDEIYTVLNDNKGNMEPYVYDSLINLLKNL